MRSSGYPDYDHRLVGEMQDWQYRPYRLDDGTAVAVCTSIVFRYRMK
jgi:hypothetical protein